MEPVFRAWYEKKMYASEFLARETNRVQDLLRRIRTIAILGISKDPHKDSHYVGRYLKNAGYTIVPVNPSAKEILGERTYPSLRDIPFPVDAVDVFRKASDIPEAFEETLAIGAGIFWIQLGIEPAESVLEHAEKNKVTVIKNRCMKVDHQFLMRQPY